MKFSFHNQITIKTNNKQFTFFNEMLPSIFIPLSASKEYNKNLEPYKEQKEGLDRCKLCYKIRMDEAYKYASDNNFDYFTTVMTISRQKNSIVLNNIGLELQEKYKNTKYFIADFKKNKGIDKGLEIAKERNMYRQDYCGCIYSYNKRKSD